MRDFLSNGFGERGKRRKGEGRKKVIDRRNIFKVAANVSTLS
jgi:hypothetical protein